ncbi:hypothetical protein L1D44_06310, partial [Shewanella sp. Isolate13]|uniref:hypothetical protein n=1 Tax=Shewanella sp. Isolate13 TaxID=2908531 RepID=UPI001EFCD313
SYYFIKFGDGLVLDILKNKMANLAICQTLLTSFKSHRPAIQLLFNSTAKFKFQLRLSHIMVGKSAEKLSLSFIRQN